MYSTCPLPGKYYIGYLSSPDNWGIRLHQSDIEQLTVTTGVDTVSAARGIAVNPDGTFTADSAARSLSTLCRVLPYGAQQPPAAHCAPTYSPASTLPCGTAPMPL